MDSATILILGVTGHGKSLLANRLLNLNPNDKTRFNFRTERSRAAITSESEVFSKTIDKLKLTIIDTPGFFDNKEDLNEKWIDVLKAYLLVDTAIDAIIIVVNSRRLSTAAQCFNRMHDCLDGVNINREIVVFTHFDDTSDEKCEKYLKEFNKLLKKGTLGMKYIFSDQEAEEEVVEKNMADIIDYVKDTQNKSAAPIDKAVFSRYTEEYFLKTISRCHQKVVTLDDLYNSPTIKMEVIEKFIAREDIVEMIKQRNKCNKSCMVM